MGNFDFSPQRCAQELLPDFADAVGIDFMLISYAVICHRRMILLKLNNVLFPAKVLKFSFFRFWLNCMQNLHFSTATCSLPAIYLYTWFSHRQTQNQWISLMFCRTKVSVCKCARTYVNLAKFWKWTVYCVNFIRPAQRSWGAYRALALSSSKQLTPHFNFCGVFFNEIMNGCLCCDLYSKCGAR